MSVQIDRRKIGIEISIGIENILLHKASYIGESMLNLMWSETVYENNTIIILRYCMLFYHVFIYCQVFKILIKGIRNNLPRPF